MSTISLIMEIATTGNRYLVGDFDQQDFFNYDRIYADISEKLSTRNAAIVLEEDEVVLTTPSSQSYRAWNKFADRLIRAEASEATLKIMFI